MELRFVDDVVALVQATVGKLAPKCPNHPGKIPKFRPKSEVRPLAQNFPKKYFVPDPDKKVSNRQISVRGVQKHHFQSSMAGGRVLTTQTKFRKKIRKFCQNCRYLKKKSWCVRRKKSSGNKLPLYKKIAAT